ncbi:Spy/CpxP family protein refolding chaperone [Labrys monachus]|uniref:Spy/CpxP family protein refolding chaperone n=1 Tax=Labrys monachus TaxID=217067 RepID=A0ABU0FCD9_9HYPH|nr:Spy/CpxP family protein refolding chaperone [Labrys monachus]MDQ0392272.1 Spy/CpxP family protein refolding chaperone [Labrys monachus]
MTDGELDYLAPKPASGEGEPARRRMWPRALLFGGAVAGGMALGAAGLAGAAVMGDHMGWHPRGSHLAHMQNFVRMALDSVAATSDQEAKIHDIVASAFTDLAPKPEDRAALAKQAIELLRAPTIDKAGVEKLRTDFVGQMDAKSKRFVDALLQAADVLTPDQRAKLADRAAFWAEHPPQHPPMMGAPGWRHGEGPDGGPDGDRHGIPGAPDDNQGPDND